MEGTLSLFDWRPQEAAPVREPAIVVFDCETTGIDPTRDQIIELCVQHGLAADAPKQVWRIKPAVAIHPAAQNVHGIAIEALAACPMFAQVADEIAMLFARVDIVIGYNVAFDIDMLQAEYARLGRPLLDFSGKRIVDAFRLWQKFEPRSLQHAHERFVGGGFEAAHSANADVAATSRVLVGMLGHFGLDGKGWDEIALIADPQPQRTSWVGPSRHLRWDGETIVVNFGKHADAPLCSLDRGFLEWVCGKDFPVHVVEICREALARDAEQLHAWARTRFGQPAPTAQPPFAR